ncbi:MAG TPA: thioredoxin family protein [Candidatus Acidoferrum sp.]|nr:thioredoxin family protein [Candidatus Acidoferrum sp.]
MKTSRIISMVALLLLCAGVAAAQSTFEPLNRWKAALQSGNEVALAALYSKIPPAQVQTETGTVQDPEAEARYWSAAVAKGPTSLNPKLLTVEPRQPGLVEVVLRVEMTLPGSSGPQPFVAAVHQLWQQQGTDWRIVATRRSDLEPNPPRRLPEPAKPKTDLYAPPEEAQSEIEAALASAAKDHKRVILVFGANWCYDCHVLDAAFHSKAIAPLVEANYHVVHINVGDEDKNLDLAEKYGVPLKKGIPALAVLDSDGKLVYSQKQGEFENSFRIGPADVTAFLKKWAPSHQG